MSSKEQADKQRLVVGVDDDEMQTTTTTTTTTTTAAAGSLNSKPAVAEQQPTPLPKKIFVPLIGTLFMESISYVTPMPFVGNYVSHLTGGPIVESGRVSGFIVGSFYLGTIISGSWWGRISDQFGRRPVLVFGLLVQALLELLFGLAPSLWVCFVVRLLQGLFNGMQATSKTVIAEATDSTNEATGFALMSLAWSGGVFIGMALGGTYGTYEPEINGHTFPAFVPCCIMAMFAVACAAGVHFVLPETNALALPISWPALKEFLASGGVVTSCAAAAAAGKAAATSSSSAASSSDKISSPVVVVPKSKDDPELDDEKNSNSIDSVGDAKKPVDDFTFNKMWTLPGLRAAMIDYLLLSSHEIAFDEVFPLIAVSPTNVAGFSMTVGEVALTVFYSGFFMIASVYAFPFVRKWYGDFVYVYASCVLCFCYIAIPQMELAAVDRAMPRLLPLAVLFPFRTWANDFCYSQALMMIPRAAPAEHVGTVTSMSTTAAAVVRLGIPPLASWLFSFSVTTLVSFYPWNSTLCFALCAVLALAGAIHRRGYILKTLPQQKN